MDYIIIISIIIILIILTFLMIIVMPKSKCFYEELEIDRDLLLLSREDINKVIVDECKLYVKNQSTMTNFINIITLWEANGFNELTNQEVITQTMNNLRFIPGVEQVALCVINQNSCNAQTKFTVDKKMAYGSKQLGCIIPIEVHGNMKSSIWVDGESKFFAVGGIILYDMNKEFNFTNKHKSKKTVFLHLILCV